MGFGNLLMKIKQAILAILARDELKKIVDDLEIANVDRRSVDGMRSAVSRSRRATPEDLLGYVRKDQLQEICQGMGLATNGKRDELIKGIESQLKQSHAVTPVFLIRWNLK